MEKLFHVVLTQNMDLYPSVLNFTATEYDEWLDQFGLLEGISEHVVHNMNIKTLTDNTVNLLFCYNLNYTEESNLYNLHRKSLCGWMYPFIKPILVRD